MSKYWVINNNLIEEFNELHNKIKNLMTPPDKIEAKIFYDHLISIHKRFVSNEIQAEASIMECTFLKKLTDNIRPYHLIMMSVKRDLTAILSQTEPSSPTETHQPHTVPKLDSQLQKQNFLIKQIDSLEISDNHCPVRADVLYHHLNRLYDSFVSNHIEIEAHIDGSTLEKQEKIATEFQRKVIDSQIKLKKIMTPVVSTPPTESTTSNQLPPIIQPSTTSNLDTLLKKAESLIQGMASLVHQTMGEISVEKAEELYDQFVSLDDSFVSNQNKIETEYNCAILNSLLETSKKLKQKEIDLQTKIKQVALPSVPSTSTQLNVSLTTSETESKPKPQSVILAEELKTTSNLVAEFDALIDSMWNKSKIGSLRSD